METLPQIKCLKCEFYKGINKEFKPSKGFTLSLFCSGLGKTEIIIINENLDCPLFISKGKRMNIIHNRNINYRSVY